MPFSTRPAVLALTLLATAATAATAAPAATAAAAPGAAHAADPLAAPSRIERSRPVRPCVVPVVRRGATVAAARTALGNAGCRPKLHDRRVHSSVRRGRVVRLSHTPGTVLPSFTFVGLVVSKGPRPAR